MGLELSAPLCAEPVRIASLTNGDLLFRQYSDDVADSRRRIMAGESPERLLAGLTLYVYRVQEGEDLLDIAARCTVPYETIATLNRMDRATSIHAGQDLILPSVPGLYIAEKPVNDMEQLLFAARGPAGGLTFRLGSKGAERTILFLPSAEFSPTERIFFLNAGFKFPLPQARLTSVFGIRKNPVTGEVKFHGGIDLAASVGTPVYATRDGIVETIGNDPVYGNYIVITHDAGWKSLYGHLSSVDTVLRSEVRSGSMIGRVGTTGQSTGPHLHFELRHDGTARDPASLLPKGMKR